MLEFLNLFYYNLFDKNSSLIRNSKRFFISLCKYKNNILIYKKIREKFLLKMNFIILRIIFRKYLHISKILLFACTLFIIKNFYQISTY